MLYIFIYLEYVFQQSEQSKGTANSNIAYISSHQMFFSDSSLKFGKPKHNMQYTQTNKHAEMKKNQPTTNWWKIKTIFVHMHVKESR